MRPILEALNELHENCHIIHRDIKCENILFDSNFDPYLADFGLSTKMIVDGKPIRFVKGIIGSR